MEIEKKFLLKEKEKIYANKEFFPQIDAIKKEIKTKGKKINQSYLPLNLLDEIKEKLSIELKFDPSEIRIRKINDDYTITFKSQNNIKRSEYEKTISKEFYKKYKLKEEKSIEKYRLKKIIKNNFLEIDYYPIHSLIIAEIELKQTKNLNKIPKFGKDVSKESKYYSFQLAN